MDMPGLASIVPASLHLSVVCHATGVRSSSSLILTYYTSSTYVPRSFKFVPPENLSVVPSTRTGLMCLSSVGHFSIPATAVGHRIPLIWTNRLGMHTVYNTVDVHLQLASEC